MTAVISHSAGSSVMLWPGPLSRFPHHVSPLLYPFSLPSISFSTSLLSRFASSLLPDFSDFLFRRSPFFSLVFFYRFRSFSPFSLSLSLARLTDQRFLLLEICASWERYAEWRAFDLVCRWSYDRTIVVRFELWTLHFRIFVRLDLTTECLSAVSVSKVFDLLSVEV